MPSVVVSAGDRERFETNGYLVVEDVVDPSFDAIWAEYQVVLDEIAGAAGIDLPADRPVTQRLLDLATRTGSSHAQHFDISLPRFGITPDTPLHVGPAMFAALRDERLLDVVEAFVGPEIYCNPVQHIRMKLPAGVARDGDHGALLRVPWHQDQGVVLPEADATATLTVWMPLTPATVDNGCLHVIPGSHRRGLVTHCALSSSSNPGGIPDALLGGRAVPVPIEPGTVLLLHRNTIHTSFANRTTAEVRVSLDLRYHPVGQPTGRPAFPGFIARSRRDPTTELRDPATWARSWLAARDELAANPSRGGMSRWRRGDPLCA
ncbi:MAG: phytanoyl-CoA dioxygenase family protein [Ilumatobacteraceae bacterium]